MMQDFPNLQPDDKEFLKKIEGIIPIVADVSRADVLIYGRASSRSAVVLAHAQPHSIAPVFPNSIVGERCTIDEEPMVLTTLTNGWRKSGQQMHVADRAPVFKETFPILSPLRPRRVIGVFCVESNLIERERLKRRSRKFQQALDRLHMMVPMGWLEVMDKISPFFENEGIILVNSLGEVIYASGIAANLYRGLGYLADLVGRHLSSLETHDLGLFKRVLKENACVEMESDEGQRAWVRKGIPILVKANFPNRPHDILGRQKSIRRLESVMILVRDETERRKKEQELRIKSAMIQEVHHRVKNNLQTIAALLRIQARRIESVEARQSLEEAISRILSVAVIHEFLSDKSSGIINIKEVSQRILKQLKQGIINPDKNICIDLQAEAVFLPSRQATACAMIMNELLQNAVEHAFKTQETGTILLKIEDLGNDVQLIIKDNGMGLPPEFDINNMPHLGLQIVRTLVREDLGGSIEMHDEDGAIVSVIFPKTSLGGEEDWNAPGYM